jgi:hypothetical protein
LARLHLSDREHRLHHIGNGQPDLTLGAGPIARIASVHAGEQQIEIAQVGSRMSHPAVQLKADDLI